MAQTTIWLPGDLHEQVKAAGLNMSQICQQALRAALAQKVEIRDVTDIEAIVTRLRASKDEQSKEIYGHGRKWGRDWAAKEADWAELEAISADRDGWNMGGNDFLIDQFSEDERTCRENGQPWDYDIVLDGFKAGAMEIYEAVADQL